MKRFFIFLMCNSLLTMSSFAQFHKIGEAFVKDGVPCVVINVDESGKHGMAMSLVPNPKALKAAKKTGEHKWFYIRKKLTGKDKKLINEYRAEYYNRNKCESLKIRVSGVAAPTRTVTSLSGKENMKNVISIAMKKALQWRCISPNIIGRRASATDGLFPVRKRWRCSLKYTATKHSASNTHKA